MPLYSATCPLPKNQMLRRHQASAPFSPTDIAGISLWLKADAGVTTSRNTYTSQIILSGATSSILNKTFVASGTPDPNNYYSYSFAENNGYFITYSQDDTPYYNLRYIAQNTGNIIILNSSDGISWSLVYNMPNTITISGITGTHSSANTTYNLYSYDGDNDIFYFPASGSDYYISTGDGSGSSSTNWFLYKVDPNSYDAFLISTGPLKSSAPSGSWTNNLSSGSPSSTYVGVANGTLPTGSVTTSEYGDFAVTAWADQSGNGNNFSQDLDYIAYREEDIINGYDGVLFEGGRLNGDSDIVTAKTIYAVVRALGVQVSAYAVILECTGGSLYSAIDDVNWGSYFGGAYFPTNSLAPNTSAIIATLSDDGENYEFRRDGSSVLSGSDGGGFVSRSASYLGSDGSAGQPANVYISEIIVYDNVPSPANIALLEAYLLTKYDI